MTINHLAVFTCAMWHLLLGALWYSPLLFYRPWLRATGMTEEAVAAGQPAKMYGLSFLLAYVMAYNLAFFLGDASTDWAWGMTAGFLAGFGWVAALFVSIGLFEQRPWSYLAIHAGYIVIDLTVMGLILGFWR